MTGSQTSAKPHSAQVNALRYQMLRTTIPLKEGGGVVFPHGFPGRGYRLDEWQFDRYRGRLDQSMLSDAARMRRRLAIAVLLVVCLALFAGSFGLPLLKDIPAVAPYLGTWVQLILLIVTVLAVSRVLYSVVHQPTRLLEEIEDAPQVSPFAFLTRRAQGALVSGQVSILAAHINCLMGGLFGAFFLFVAVADISASSESLVLALLASLWTAHPILLCYAYWRFRLRHGRKPTAGDLEPV